MRYLLLTTLLPQLLCQYVADMGMRPDVTFGDQNDRFDLTAVVQQQNRIFDRPEFGDYDSRRQGQILINGQLQDFSYRTDSRRAAPSDHRQNVNKFFAKNTKRVKELVDRLQENIKTMRSAGFPYKNRRSIEPLSQDLVDRVMSSHVVPVEMTIQGYIQAPLEVLD